MPVCGFASMFARGHTCAKNVSGWNIWILPFINVLP